LNIESLAEGEYTLTITNAEGCSRSYTVEIGVSVGVHDQSEAAFQLYPMPANDVVQLGAHNFNAVEVFGLNGRMVLQGRVRNQSSLDVSELAPGGYILVLDGWKTERLLIVR